MLGSLPHRLIAQRRRGFANSQLVAAIGIVFLLGLFAMVKDLNLGLALAGMVQGKPAASKAKSASKAGSKSSKSAVAAPPLIPDPANPLEELAPELNRRRQNEARRRSIQAYRARHSLARMDAAAAARLLEQLALPEALNLLRGLDEYALGRICEAAQPQLAGQWLSALNKPEALAPLAPGLSSAADSFGLDNQLDSLLSAQGLDEFGAALTGPEDGGVPTSQPDTAPDSPPVAAEGQAEPAPAAAETDAAGDLPPAVTTTT